MKTLIYLLCALNCIGLVAADIEAGWRALDVESRRAMWVWSVAKTRQGLPDDPREKPTKGQRWANKKFNKTWDGESAAKRFHENYRGIQDLFFDFCENKSINELYVFGSTWEWSRKELDRGMVSDEVFWVAFNAKAKARGIRVWLTYYLWDNPDDPRMKKDFAGMTAHAKAVYNFNKAHPEARFVGIHCDQEPRKKDSYPGMLTDMRDARRWVESNHANIVISHALRPAWLREEIDWNGTSKPMAHHVMDEISHGALMCYHDRMNVVQKWSGGLVDYAGSVDKKVSIGFEVNNLYGAWAGSERETWWEEIQEEPVSQRFMVNLKDSKMTFEDAMHLTNESLSSQKGYDRMVVHGFAGYFEHWFGKAPRDYVESLPAKRYVPGTMKPAKVDLRKDQRPVYGVER